MKKLKLSDDKQKKWDNFWYYYKYHVLIGVFVLFVAIVFIKDMVTKVSYDYTIAVVGSTGLIQEDQDALQKWFEENGEDLNKDGEVHVQISDYFLAFEGDAAYDPQMLAANQTKFTVDVQEGTSMIYFVNDKNYDRFKDEGIFPDKEEMTAAENCKGFEEAGSPDSVKEMFIGMRTVDEKSKLAKKEGTSEYYEASERLMEKFINGGER